MLKQISPAPADDTSRKASLRKAASGLKKVFKDLELDPLHPEHWDRLRTLTGSYLGRRQKLGRRKGSSRWTPLALITLAIDSHIVDARHKNMTGAKKVALIRECFPEEYQHDSDQAISRRLPGALRLWEEALNTNSGSRSDRVRLAIMAESLKVVTTPGTPITEFLKFRLACVLANGGFFPKSERVGKTDADLIRLLGAYARSLVRLANNSIDMCLRYKREESAAQRELEKRANEGKQARRAMLKAALDRVEEAAAARDYATTN